MKLVIAMLALGMIITGPTKIEAQNRTERYRQCKFQWMDPGTWTQREEERTAWCVVNRWPIPGGFPKLDSVLNCESGWNRFAYNSAGYVGLAQHSISAWPGRVRQYRPSWWQLKPGWMNSRTQIVVTVRMVREQGWTPWSCQ